MNELALFAGAGGGILGSKLLGWTTVCAVEIEPYCRRVLMQRQNDGLLDPFPIWDDVTTFRGEPWRGIVDVVSGGFPCQAFSTATRGRATATNLWFQMARIISEVAPQFVFCENVSRVAIDLAASCLGRMGYVSKAVALSASDLGADHVRKRYWLLAHANIDGELRGSVNAKMGSVPQFRPSVWQSYAAGNGVADGVAHRVDRLRAIGNGQVPIVAAAAWRFLT